MISFSDFLEKKYGKRNLRDIYWAQEITSALTGVLADIQEYMDLLAIEK